MFTRRSSPKTTSGAAQSSPRTQIFISVGTVSRRYCIVTLCDPVAQELPEEVDALTVTGPAAASVAKPGVPLVENVSFVVSLEVQVELVVTSLLLLSVAVN